MTGFYARHEAPLKRAIAAVGDRAYFSAFPESASPKVFGETAKSEGDAAFVANRFRIAPVRRMAA